MYKTFSCFPFFYNNVATFTQMSSTLDNAAPISSYKTNAELVCGNLPH